MPKTVDTLHLEYFEEGLKFLQEQPKVKKSGIGIISISKSGDLALSMASFLPNIAATVCINTCNANVMFPLHYKNTVIPGFVGNIKRIKVTKSGILNIRDILNDPMEKEETRATVIPIERAGCRFLFIVSGDDRNWNSAFFAEQACSRLAAHGKANYDLVTYPTAGHFMEVPYMPHHPSGLHAAVNQVVAFGGDPKAHAHAQVDAWTKDGWMDDVLKGDIIIIISSSTMDMSDASALLQPPRLFFVVAHVRARAAPPPTDVSRLHRA
ncbi:hypothetical protein HF521_012368 [Silurus meridionalis]|uniref:BAAT/Acyl-CoA thioester hydrolase C-terminal domain-containing protein n=1 Tax=Silurus meridionalis TaxID=175797 RepID=A0A8T0AEM7_SILME|nr:hypothetical protein HF521_012368 [Silurus meridionalis]